ncbi:unnamed protein product, partial [Lymnaea stagnalis]
MTRVLHLRCLLPLLLIGVHIALVTCETQTNSTAAGPADDAYIAGDPLTRANSPFTAFWLESTGDRARRSSYNRTNANWPHDIPYIMDSSFTGDRVTFRMVLDYISSKLCVTFHDVTTTWDKSNPTWLTQHGFKTNSIVKVIDNGGCNTGNGQGDGHSVHTVSPCSGFGINLHEMLHVLGVTHTQEGRIRDSYLTVNEEDIKSDLIFSYNKNTDPTLVNDYFDANSEMMYGDLLWNRDGLETFTPIRDDIFHLATHGTEEKVVFHELNQIYRCNELFCNNDPTDCGPGYHARVKGRCRCVCPDELDPTTNCRSFISGPTANLSWPNVPFALYGDSQCPKGFDAAPGWLPISGTWMARFDPAPRKYPTDGDHTVFQPFCVKTPDKNGASDWSSWPVGGQYCVIKPAGEHCGGVFEESFLEFTTRDQSHPNGSVGDIAVNGTMVTINYCCRGRDSDGVYLELPNSEPFRLHPIYDHCPMVRGMKSNFISIDYWTYFAQKIGNVKPLAFIYTYALLTYQCYYQPPIYGCSQNITLTSANPSATVTTPGFGTAREPNRRCFYQLNVPKKSFIRLTFNHYDLHKHDHFLVKRYHKWLDPVLLDNAKWPHQIVSESDYMALEYWASWETSQNKGANFTIDIIPAEKMCYDVYTKGADYFGEKSVTETYEDCIPWEKATSCDDFPFDGYNGISLLTSGNQCRNPNGALSQPWCYVFVRGTVCHKRYCDVCNLADPIDAIDKCPALAAKGSPDFCKTDPERFGCFKTCHFSVQTHAQVKCDPPILPHDVHVAGGLKQEYTEGEIVNITCTSSGSLVKELRCSKTGWSGEVFGCNGCPANWTSYGDRCFYYSMIRLTRQESARTCGTHDPTGTLFEVRSLADQQMIRRFKSGNSFEYQHGHWVSGQLESEYGEWLFDTGLPMTYFNWSNIAITTQIAYNCIKIIAEYENHNSQGGWKSLPCDGDQVAPFMCQVDNSVVNACHDQARNCSDVMAAFPNFCQDSRSVASATKYCRKSCGKCA